MRRFSARVLVLVAIALATRGSQPPDQEWFVPWKVLNPGEAAQRAPLVVYWLPRSRDDMRHSELLTSRILTLYSTQCVAMHVVRPDDFERLAHLGANGKAPVVLLVDADGREVTHVEQEAGALRIATVEKMLLDQLRGLEEDAERSLDEAHRSAENGERDRAIAMYRHVCELKCLLPRQAKMALRALKKMGVE